MASTTPILPRKRLLAATVGPNKGAIRSGPAAAAVAPQPATTIPQSEFRKLSGHELGLKARRAACQSPLLGRQGEVPSVLGKNSLTR